jgi:putative tricarboxylic transport membrane protein
MNGDRPSPTADLVWSLVWIAGGAALVAGGYGMDRLERQHINPYTAPGLVPAALGIGIFVLGAFLLARSARVRGGEDRAATGGASVRRFLLAAALCVAYAAGLVGRGPPFWLATALFVFVAIMAFRWAELKAEGRLAKGAAVAAACAIGTAAGVTLVFQELFLVRLP